MVSNMKKANNLFRQKKYREALIEYVKIKTDNPIFAPIIDINIRLCKKFINNTDCEIRLTFGTFVGIASVPYRERNLKLTIDSLINQVDDIGVYLDNYESVPNFLDNDRITIIRSQDYNRDLGDSGKFLWVENHHGYYFTADDDLIYPNDYIARTIDKIKFYKNKAVVGWHGGLLKTPFKDYYNAETRRVFSFSAPRPYDTPVHVLGTGCLGFNTTTIKIGINDFVQPNMADIWFAKRAQEDGVAFVVMEHKKGEIVESELSQEISINQNCIKDIDTKSNTKKIQNNVCKEISWKIHLYDTFLKIGIVGRFSTNKKGGIFKSSNILVNDLRNLGHEVKEFCISDKNQILESINGNENFDFVLVYAPDPERPDFGELIDIVKIFASKKIVCAVNFSINLNIDRSNWIYKKIIELNSPFSSPRIFIATFTNASSMIKELYGLEKYMVVFPKTLDPGESNNLDYNEREGVFFGDIAKLTNHSLTHTNSVKWIEQVRIRMPHVNIYALKHYHTDKKLQDYINIIPYSNNLSEILSRFRISVCLTPGATFEMIPVESAMLGTPVIHRSMPQSLSEYLSPISTVVNSPAELGEMSLRIYENENIWRKLSSASASLKTSLFHKNLCASIENSIRICLLRSKGH